MDDNLLDNIDCEIAPNRKFIERNVADVGDYYDEMSRVINNNFHKYKKMITKELINDLADDKEFDFIELLHNSDLYRTSPKYDSARYQKFYYKQHIKDLKDKNPDLDVSGLMEMVSDETAPRGCDYIRDESGGRYLKRQ